MRKVIGYAGEMISGGSAAGCHLALHCMCMAPYNSLGCTVWLLTIFWRSAFCTVLLLIIFLVVSFPQSSLTLDINFTIFTMGSFLITLKSDQQKFKSVRSVHTNGIAIVLLENSRLRFIDCGSIKGHICQECGVLDIMVLDW